MKQKSGNGTTNRQWIYCLWMIFPNPLLFKVGISGNLWARLSEINKSTFGVVVPVFACRIWGAYYWEQFILGLLYPLKWRVNGSGGSEYRLFGIIALPLILLAFLLDRLFLYLVSIIVIWFLSGCPQEPIRAILQLLN